VKGALRPWVTNDEAPRLWQMMSQRNGPQFEIRALLLASFSRTIFYCRWKAGNGRRRRNARVL
jgi:hypothetical protein